MIGASSDQQILKKVLEACKIEETKGINRGIVDLLPLNAPGFG